MTADLRHIKERIILGLEFLVSFAVSGVNNLRNKLN